MASPAVTYTFSNSTTADATQVNQNYTDLINGATDGTKDYSINALTVAGTATLNGDVNIGNASADTLVITASLGSAIPIKTTYSYDIGAATLGLKRAYFGSNDSAARSVYVRAGIVTASYGIDLPPAVPASAKSVMVFDTGGLATFETKSVVTVATKTTTYNPIVAADDTLFLDATSAGFTSTLPAATGSGKVYRFVKIDTTTNAATISRAGSDTIETATTGAAATSLTLQTYGEVVEMIDGASTKWYVIRRDYPKNWKTFTPTGTWSTNTTYTGAYRRIGDCLEVWNAIDTAGAPTSATLTVTLPLSLTIDTAKLSASANNMTMGHCSIQDSSTNLYDGTVRYASTTTIQPVYIGVSGALIVKGDITQAAPFTFGAGDGVYLRYLVPITGWS